MEKSSRKNVSIFFFSDDGHNLVDKHFWPRSFGNSRPHLSLRLIFNAFLLFILSVSLTFHIPY